MEHYSIFYNTYMGKASEKEWKGKKKNLLVAQPNTKQANW